MAQDNGFVGGLVGAALGETVGLMLGLRLGELLGVSVGLGVGAGDLPAATQPEFVTHVAQRVASIARNSLQQLAWAAGQTLHELGWHESGRVGSAVGAAEALSVGAPVGVLVG